MSLGKLLFGLRTRKCNSGLFHKGNTVRRIDLNVFSVNSIRLLKTQPVDEELIKEATDASVEDLDEVMAKREEEIERKRNKSRLNPAHRNILHGNIPYPEPMAPFHETVKYQRKMYARYGKASGVNPGILWPTKEDLEEILEYESVAYPETLQELISKAQIEKEKRLEEIKAREKEIAEKYAALSQLKKKLQAKEAQKLAAVQAAKEKRDQLVEEVRRHFGYKVDVRDPHFKEMLEKKEKEQKKMAKEANKKAKEALVLAKLQGLNLVEPAKVKEKVKEEEEIKEAKVQVKEEKIKAAKTQKNKKDEDDEMDSDDEEEITRNRKSKK